MLHSFIALNLFADYLVTLPNLPNTLFSGFGGCGQITLLTRQRKNGRTTSKTRRSSQTPLQQMFGIFICFSIGLTQNSYKIIAF
jgi:hypothetical protein